MIEHAKAAFAGLNGLLIPGFGEEGALAPQRLDEDLDLGVAKGASEVRAEFGEQPSRPVPPVGNKLSSRGLEERKAQEVALTIAIQPTAKEPRRGLIPAAGAPQSVEPIGRTVHCIDGGDQEWRRVRGGPARSFGIKAPRKLEQIVAFGARQG